MAVPEQAPPPDPAEVRDWLYPYNLLVRNAEMDGGRWTRAGLDWRLVWEPAFKEGWHSIRLLALARDPAQWEQPALQVILNVRVSEWQESLEQGDAKLLELITVKIEMLWRTLIETMLNLNPESQRRVLSYI